MKYRTAFVTGASSGIGWELARRLALLGTEVAIAARREDRLRDLQKVIEGEGGHARVYPLDVGDTALTVATIRRADEDMRGLDLLVANAGMGQSRAADELGWSDCEPILRVNVAGAVATLMAILERMVARRRGHLVGVSSLAQVRGLPANALYSGSKAFLSTFLEGLRVDLQGSGVVVTDVRPGFVNTPLTAKNSFPMPWMMSVQAAVEVIVGGIESGAKVISFPWQLAALAGGARFVPRALYDALATRVKRTS
jgi:short-subunit dehydrogenase